MDMEGGKPQAVGPADFIGVAVAKDGRRIAGRSASGETVVFDRETQKLEVIPGIAPQESLSKWTEDGRALIVSSSSTPWQARIYRLEVATGQRTLLQTIEPTKKAGSTMPMRVAYAEGSRTYATARYEFWETFTWWKDWSKKSDQPRRVSALPQTPE
jgi:hypothetical protein